MNQRADVAVIGDAADAIALIGEALPGAPGGRRARAAAVRAALDGEWAAGATGATRRGCRRCAPRCRTTR